MNIDISESQSITDPGNDMPSVLSIVCRICYDVDKDEELIKPCNCKGTVAYVHQSCLEIWLEESNTSTCELCHHVFNVERIPKFSSSKSVFYWCWRYNDSQVRNDILACSLITPLTIIITYVCLLSSEYYNQIKFSNEPAARWTSFSLLFMIAVMLIGYYMWVYSVLRMHARRWYSWWQRTYSVRLITSSTIRIIDEDDNDSLQNVIDSLGESNSANLVENTSQSVVQNTASVETIV